MMFINFFSIYLSSLKNVENQYSIMRERLMMSRKYESRDEVFKDTMKCMSKP